MAKKAKENCPHPSFTQERISGQGTGDYLCDVCGELFLFSEVEKLRGDRICQNCGKRIKESEPSSSGIGKTSLGPVHYPSCPN